MPTTGIIFSAARRQFLTAIAAALLAGAIAACSEQSRMPTAPAPAVLPVARVTIEASADSVRMYIGTTVDLSAVVSNPRLHALPNKKHLEWRSSEPRVATVSNVGVVTGLDTGRTLIVVVHKGAADTVRVAVVLVPVKRVIVLPSALRLDRNQTFALTAMTLDSAGGLLLGRPIVWRSSAEEVASVDALGLVKGLTVGVATITAVSEGKSGSSEVVVVPPPGEVATVVIGGGGDPAIFGTGCPDLLSDAQFYAYALDRDGFPVTHAYPPPTWSYSPDGIITFTSGRLPGPNYVQVTGIGAGTATLRATIGGVVGERLVTPYRCNR